MKPVHYHEGRFPPEDILDWKKLIPLIGPAYGAVARYDGMLAALPSAGALLAPLTTREAVLSSRIEGHPRDHGRGAGIRGRDGAPHHGNAATTYRRFSIAWRL